MTVLAVRKVGDSWNVIGVEITNEMLAKCQCKVKKPTGNCCTKAFNEAIRKGIELKNS